MAILWVRTIAGAVARMTPATEHSIPPQRWAKQPGVVLETAAGQDPPHNLEGIGGLSE